MKKKIKSPPKTRPPVKKTKGRPKPKPKATETDKLRQIWEEDLCE